MSEQLDKTDTLRADGVHWYWSTWCRHDNHDPCKATEHAPGVPRNPAQCKSCGAPCLCDCHKGPPGAAQA